MIPYSLKGTRASARLAAIFVIGGKIAVWDEKGNRHWKLPSALCYILSNPELGAEMTMMEAAGADAGKFDAVLFDMDGVLVDSEELIARAAMMMFKERYSIDVPRDAFYPYVGAGEDRYIGGPAAERGLAVDLRAAKARTYEFYDELATEFLKILPGAAEYLHSCREMGLKIALASAADLAKVLINLRILGIKKDFFDAVVTGSDIERKKPFPDIYLLAASQVGVESGRSLVVEDAVNGIMAGVAAGARCLGLTTSFSEEELRKAGASWCSPNLDAAPLPYQLD